jgi:hypothetical protein
MVANFHLKKFALPLTVAIVLAASSQAQAADLYYYDGGVKRSLTIDPPSATSTNKLSGKSIAGSPVFRTSAAGSAMALPGGVILVPKSNSDEVKLMDSLRAKGLEVERPIGGTGAFLVRSREGMAALELANQLHESGEFESVSPNWWRERSKK